MLAGMIVAWTGAGKFYGFFTVGCNPDGIYTVIALVSRFPVVLGDLAEFNYACHIMGENSIY